MSFYILLLIGTVPAAVVGFLFQSVVEDLFSSVKVVGVALLVTAFLNLLVDRATARRDKLSRIDAAFVGIAQAIAIVPGISRSGATIFAGVSMGVDRKAVAEFSFLLSVPAILGAGFLQFLTHTGEGSVNLASYAGGAIAAFVVGVFAISVVLRLLSEKQFKVFAIYCAIVGLIALLL